MPALTLRLTRLSNSFFGGLEAGTRYADLAAKGTPLEGELLTTERIVGPLTSVVQGKTGAASFRAGLADMYEALGEPVPGFVMDAFVTAVAKRTRALIGQWNATPFGTAMELNFQV